MTIIDFIYTPGAILPTLPFLKYLNMFNSLNSEKVHRTHHRLFAEVTVDASHFVLVHLVQFGMNLKTKKKKKG